MTIEIKTDKCGNIRYYKDGSLHREDGPAVIYPIGRQEWYRNDKLHREDGPAVIKANGTQMWYLNGLRHRDDGPAVMWATGRRNWWFDGSVYSFNEWCRKANITDQQKTLLVLKYNP